MTLDHYPLIHIGYHKTGTTWLQKHLFTNTAIGFTSPLSVSDLMTQLVVPHALDFDAEACRAFFEPRLRVAREAGLVPVVSRERLSGVVHVKGDDAMEMASRLHAVFPNGRVLIVIREQRKVLLSLYNQVVKVSSAMSLAESLRPSPLQRHGFRLEHFRYDSLIRYYMNIFGPSNILVLPYEQFSVEPKEFVGTIVGFCDLVPQEALMHALPYGERMNTSLSGISLAIKRPLNRIIGGRPSRKPGLATSINYRVRRWLEWADQRLPATWKAAANQRLMRQIEAIVDKEYYAESNRITAELTGLDLAQYGYEMGVEEPCPTTAIR